MIWHWIKISLLILVGLLLFFVLVVLPFGLAHLITHAKTRPMDRDLTGTPADFQVPYREVQFFAYAKPPTDGDGGAKDVPISAWYLPRADAKALVIYAHGLFRSRHEMLERAAKLWQLGYAGLVLDLRRHGKSGGKLSGMGYLEQLDILAAVDFARDSLNLDRPIIGFGVSMGAAAMILAAEKTPEIDALIVDSSFLSFENTVSHHLKMWFGLPRFPLGDLLMFFSRLKVGFSYEEFDMARALQKLNNRPILIIAGGADRRMPPEVEKALFTSANSERKFFVVIPGAKHGAGFRTDPEKYMQAVAMFLQRFYAKQ